MSLQPFSLEEINFAIQSLEANGEDKGEVSDGYHTFNELYDHRYALFIALTNTYLRNLPSLPSGKVITEVAWEGNPIVEVWKSKLHYDGSSYEGYFILGMITIYGAVSYHIPMKYWGNSEAPILDKGRKWDGYTSKDVLEILLKF